MDIANNPFFPGAGTQPKALAGRDELLSRFHFSAKRVRAGAPAQSLMLIGLRGVGKTVLLKRMRHDADQAGLQTFQLEAQGSRSLPSMLVPHLRKVLIRLSGIEKAKDLSLRALSALAGFVKALRFKFSDIELDIQWEPIPGIADNGVFEDDLVDLLRVIGAAASAADTALVLFIDELQNVSVKELEALVRALHEAAQDCLPIMLVGAGLPHLPGILGEAKTYAERLFFFAELKNLSEEDARTALEAPARQRGVAFEPEALDLIVLETHGYPYFLQEWGSQAWEIARQSPITLEDVKKASTLAISALDEGFFRVRYSRLPDAEKDLLMAMANLGPGPYASGDIARQLGKKPAYVAPLRSRLIAKGVIWSPRYGELAFTVPMFDAFLKRQARLLTPP